jgi:methylenetetrahydrofolate dehydrogenase (NADP+) / methenyltetrahydrofolate cyclohydrolase
LSTLTLTGKRASERDFARLISTYNSDDNFRAIIIQNPIPATLKKKRSKIVELIDVNKDIDAMSDAGKRIWGRCATADAMCRVLEAGLKPESRIAVVGSEGFVGQGIVSYLDGKKNDLLLEIGEFDERGGIKVNEIVNFQPNIITSSTGAIEVLNTQNLAGVRATLGIDCGFIVTENPDGQRIIIGDIQAEARDKFEFITPVPGGIGPMEMAVLLERFIQQEFPELQLQPWQLIKLYDLSPADLAAGNYLTPDSLTSQGNDLTQTDRPKKDNY